MGENWGLRGKCLSKSSPSHWHSFSRMAPRMSVSRAKMGVLECQGHAYYQLAFGFADLAIERTYTRLWNSQLSHFPEHVVGHGYTGASEWVGPAFHPLSQTDQLSLAEIQIPGRELHWSSWRQVSPVGLVGVGLTGFPEEWCESWVGEMLLCYFRMTWERIDFSCLPAYII